MRTCVACRAKRAPAELLRFHLDPGSVVRLDRRGTSPGRGAWLCVAPRCLRQAVKRGSFPRSFRRRVEVPPVEVLEEQVRSGLARDVDVAERTMGRAGRDQAAPQDLFHTRAVTLACQRRRAWDDR